MQINQSNLLIDTCCIINFCASDELLNILQAIPAQTTITQDVKSELDKEENIEQMKQVENAIKQGLLLVVDFESDVEANDILYYAAQNLGEGEASTGAIAINRNWTMATDDKKAIRVFSEESPSLQILSTPDIIKYWSETANIDPAKLSEVLKNIRVKARYMPPKNHSLKSWWENLVKITQSDAQ